MALTIIENLRVVFYTPFYGLCMTFSRILMAYVWTAARCLAVSRIDTKYQSTSQPCSL